MWEIAKRLAGRGHDVSLVGMRMWEGEGELVKDGVRIIGLCTSIPAFGPDGNRTFLEPFVFAAHLYFFLLRQNYHLVDCGEVPYLPALAARLATLGRKTRLVLTWHEARGLKGWLKYNGWSGAVACVFEKMAARLTRHNIGISESTRERAGKVLGLKNMTVVPCGVDCSGVAEAVAADKLDQILYVGRLVRHKRVDMLIEAFHGANESIPDCTLKIVGRGHEKQGLVLLVERLGLKDKVVFTEFMQEEELMAEYGRSKVFVLPSRQEGFGVVLIEAMAAGTPVIATDDEFSAVNTVVTTGRDGILVKTAAEMQEALKTLLTDERLYRKMAEEARKTARRYDWDCVVPEIEKFYRSVIAGDEG